MYIFGNRFKSCISGSRENGAVGAMPIMRPNITKGGAIFTRDAMLARYMLWSDCPSLCHKLVFYQNRNINIGSRIQRQTIAQGL